MNETNLDKLRNKCLTSLYGCTGNIFKYLENNDDKEEAINKLKGCVKQYCDMEKLEQSGKKTIESLEKDLDVTNWASVKNQYEEKLAQYRSKKNANFAKHSFMKELEKHIKTANREQNVDQDVVITDTIETYIDPLNKTKINHPMKNKICSHVYEKTSIEDYMKNKKNKGCPYMGCTNKQILVADHLVHDEELLHKIRSTQQEMEMDLDE